MAFTTLGLPDSILKAIEDEKFEKPSDIQAKAIPLVLQGKDVIAKSATGSGKTLAFGAGIINDVQRGNGLQALVLTPTRELAEQITQSFNKFSKYHPLKTVSIYGGVSINPQIDALERAEVAVATPGRLLDHLQRGTVNLEKINILVLDEADRMLDMGFIDDVRKIISRCKKDRQTLLFSATIAPEIADIAERFMNDPIEVSSDAYVDPTKLRQVYYEIDDKRKFSLLVHLLKQERAGLVMVFCNTQQNTDFVERNLRKNDIDAVAIHGRLSQARRSSTLEKFNSAKVGVLVCTDVAARGLDIKGVSHVYNYDIPRESKQYIHRIGRTARAGKEGIAINILTQRDHENYSRLLRDYAVDPEKMEVPEVERAFINVDKGGRGRGSRGGFRGPSRQNRGFGRREDRNDRRGSREGGRRDHSRGPSRDSERRPRQDRHHEPTRTGNSFGGRSRI
ncbi:DEAD/DEAH box helicase [Candidatus Woesearchaeota archaeon]|nr:DEAD/DEAH box helicase [Candidatus Woesearchaeota archaeon]